MDELSMNSKNFNTNGNFSRLYQLNSSRYPNLKATTNTCVNFSVHKKNTLCLANP